MSLCIRKVLVATVLTLGWSSLSVAQDLSKTYSNCMDQSGGVTVEMLNCIGSETEHQDALLNQAYRDVMAELSPERKTELRNAQRAWIKYRDLNCEFYADPDGGTMASLQSNSCFMTMTASRARELRGFQ